MFVSSDFNAILCNSVENELILLITKLIETFLNNMISVEIFREQYYIRSQSFLDELNLSSVYNPTRGKKPAREQSNAREVFERHEYHAD